MTGQRRANWETRLIGALGDCEERMDLRINSLQAKVDALEIVADCRLKHCLDFRDRIEKLERRSKWLSYGLGFCTVVITAIALWEIALFSLWTAVSR